MSNKSSSRNRRPKRNGVESTGFIAKRVFHDVRQVDTAPALEPISIVGQESLRPETKMHLFIYRDKATKPSRRPVARVIGTSVHDDRAFYVVIGRTGNPFEIEKGEGRRLRWQRGKIRAFSSCYDLDLETGTLVGVTGPGSNNPAYYLLDDYLNLGGSTTNA